MNKLEKLKILINNKQYLKTMTDNMATDIVNKWEKEGYKKIPEICPERRYKRGFYAQLHG